MSYKSDQDKGIKEVNLQVGDRVLVVASAESHQGGWQNMWVGEMDDAVGKVRTVRGLQQNGQRPEQGIELEGGWGYPFFVLVKIN